MVIPEIVSRATEMELGDLKREDLVMFASKVTPQAIREKLGKIVDLQEQLGAMREDLKVTQAGIDALFHDQDRLRENLKALRDTSEDRASVPVSGPA